MARTQAVVVGNWLAIVGALVYLLEWAAIVPAGNTGPADPGTKTPLELFAVYAAHPFPQAFLVTWLTVVLLGRVAFAVGVRAAVHPVERARWLADTAVAAMTVSVALELVTEAVVGAGSYLANHGGDASQVVVLDAVAGWMNRMIWGPFGVSVALGGVAMLVSRLFPRWIGWMGTVAGTGLAVGGILAGPSYVGQGVARSLGDALMLAVPVTWLWMLATGVFLALHTRRRTAQPPNAERAMRAG